MKDWLFAAGELAFALLLASELGSRVAPWLRRKLAFKRAAKLDWSIIDNALDAERLQRDCERQESLGICTGLDCLVYESCNFNIKKHLRA